MYVKIKEPFDVNLVANMSPFGSHTYGTNDNYSDRDIVMLLKKSTGDFIFQYSIIPDGWVTRDQCCDAIYVGEEKFYHELSIGGNQNFFETIHTDAWQDFRRTNVLEYYTNDQARGFVGLARRDLKPQFVNDRIFHINRCLWVADKIMNKSLINLKDIGKLNIETNIDKLTEKMTSMRKELINGI